MISGVFHEGSGLGNQLHRYVGTKIAALDKGEEHRMVATDLFKGASFMNLPMTDAGLEYRVEYPAGKVVVDDTKCVTILDGEFQGEESFIHRIDEVREWLKVEPIDMPDNVCVINFRGGEYAGVHELFLPNEYWNKAMDMMLAKYPNIQFEVHTDDQHLARSLFPCKVISDMGINWRSIRYAKHLILSNSSFAILPALLGEAKEIIAPRFWAGYNVGEWRMPQNQYQRFSYI